MRCENTFCIYNKKYVCTIEDVTIDSAGTCQDCILVNIPINIVEKFKKENQKKYDSK